MITRNWPRGLPVSTEKCGGIHNGNAALARGYQRPGQS